MSTTTGLADPVLVAQTFFMDDDVRAKTELDAVVALVDAKHLPLRLKDSREAEDQIAFADVVVINKSDLVTSEELAQIEGSVRAINPGRPRLPDHAARGVDLARVLDQGAFNLERALENDPHFLEHGYEDHGPIAGPDCRSFHEPHAPHHLTDHDHDHHHYHDHDHHHHGLSAIHDVTVQSISLRGGEMNPDRFFPWIQKITPDRWPEHSAPEGHHCLQGRRGALGRPGSAR